MEGVPASILQSAQNVKLKLLSIIRGVSTINYCLPTFRTTSPYPNNLSGTRWGNRGFWVRVKLVKCREKKKKKSKPPQPNLSPNNTVRKLASLVRVVNKAWLLQQRGSEELCPPV